MTQEHKELLIKDLCSRLPYGVIVETPKGKGHVCDINLTIFGTKVGVNINPTIRDTFDVEDTQLYLFPLSSMTEEQREEIEDKLTFPNNSDGGWIEILYNNKYEIPFWFVDFCNKNHLDYRGLIPMGLAIDCTNSNIY